MLTEDRCNEILLSGGARKNKLSAEDLVEYKRWKERRRNKERRLNPEYRKKEKARQQRWIKANPERSRAKGRRHYYKYVNNPEYREHARDRRRKYSFGFSIGEFDQRLAQQSGRCAVCGDNKPLAPKGKIPWCIDHNHSTGKVRGILCNPCNKTLGHTKENVERLKQLIVYLEKGNGVSNA